MKGQELYMAGIATKKPDIIQKRKRTTTVCIYRKTMAFLFKITCTNTIYY